MIIINIYNLYQTYIKHKPRILIEKYGWNKSYLLEEIKQNKLMSRKYKKVCTTMDYVERFLILASACTGCI